VFSITSDPLNRSELCEKLINDKAGALVVFEGWVRDHNQGKKVSSLEYQIYETLALKEGSRIIEEAKQKFNIHEIAAVHRQGHLKLSDTAIWIGATSSHRDDAFKASRFVIDEIKHRLPVWKKEHYCEGGAEWVYCRHHHHHIHFCESDYYQKQVKLIEQDKLKDASVMVVGAGGLGCPALVSLAMAGVAKITIVDPDKISISNIHRQFIYAPNLVGEKKAIVARNFLMNLNPFIKVEALTASFAPELIEDHDLVLDCTDNMKAKYLIHDACLIKGIPFISAGVYQDQGQLRTIVKGKGCWRCFVSTTPDDTLLGNCNDFGVIGATTNIIGSMQAKEAVEFLLKGHNASLDHTILIDTHSLKSMSLKNSYRDDCEYCSGLQQIIYNELEVEKVGDALLVDIRGLQEEDLAPYQDSSRKVILYCDRGIRSLKVVEQLRAQGHQHFYSLKGGVASL
jgi:sulfur-carrier protein adenylyltransferase/sulfurtransferase